jgi:Phage major capsid protein E
MPNEIDLYDQRTLLQAMEQKPPVRTFLMDTFFKNTVQSYTEKVDIDIIKGKRRVACYVSPVKEGHVVKRDGYSTNTYTAPYIKEKIPAKAGLAFKRLAGETLYSGVSPMERINKIIADELSELDDMITRAEEIQAAQGLFTGHVIVKDENGIQKDDIDFQLDGTHNLTLSGSNLWSATDFKKNALLAQFRTWRKLLIRDSGIAPTDIVLGTDTADKFIAVLDPDDETSGISSVRVDRGQINPQNLPGGVTYWGFFAELGCDIWSYDEYYLSGSSTVAMVPEKKVWMGSRNARFDKNYGVIQDLDSMVPVARFPKSWDEKDPSIRWLMLQSAPLMAPHQVDSFLVAQVL